MAKKNKDKKKKKKLKKEKKDKKNNNKKAAKRTNDLTDKKKIEKTKLPIKIQPVASMKSESEVLKTSTTGVADKSTN